MERQEPQGEENGDLLIPMNPQANMHISQLEARHLGGSVRPRPPLTALDAHNMFPSLPRSLHEELLSQQQAKFRHSSIQNYLQKSAWFKNIYSISDIFIKIAKISKAHKF